MSATNCRYHPEQRAVGHCRSCHRAICKGDRQEVISTDFVKFDPVDEGIYCSTCYYDLANALGRDRFSRDMAGAISFIIMIFFGGFLMLLILLGVDATFVIYFFAIFIFIAISMVWIVHFIVSSNQTPPINLEHARFLHQKLINSKRSPQRYVQSQKPIKSQEGQKPQEIQEIQESLAFEVSNNPVDPMFTKSNPQNNLFCMNCGGTIASDMRFCPSCGDNLHAAK